MTIIARSIGFFLETPATMLAAIIDITVHVEFFGPKAKLSRLEMDVCQYFVQQEFFQRFGRRA